MKPRKKLYNKLRKKRFKKLDAYGITLKDASKVGKIKFGNPYESDYDPCQI